MDSTNLHEEEVFDFKFLLFPLFFLLFAFAGILFGHVHPLLHVDVVGYGFVLFLLLFLLDLHVKLLFDLNESSLYIILLLLF